MDRRLQELRKSGLWCPSATSHPPVAAHGVRLLPFCPRRHPGKDLKMSTAAVRIVGDLPGGKRLRGRSVCSSTVSRNALMTAIEWYYAKGDQQQGPVSSAELKQLAELHGMD